MPNLIKVEITNLDTKEWQWLGKLTPENLTKLTEYADKLSDEPTGANTGEKES